MGAWAVHSRPMAGHNLSISLQYLEIENIYGGYKPTTYERTGCNFSCRQFGTVSRDPDPDLLAQTLQLMGVEFHAVPTPGSDVISLQFQESSIESCLQ
jgi:hypothetical protein